MKSCGTRARSSRPPAGGFANGNIRMAATMPLRCPWLVVLLCLAGLARQAPAQVPPTAAAPASMDPAFRALLGRLDDHFNRRDVDAYAAAFAPDHGPAHARHLQELQQRLALGLHRRSTAIDAPRTTGQRQWVRLRHDFFQPEPTPGPAGAPAAAAVAPVLTEYSLLAAAADPTGSWRAHFAVVLPDSQPLPPGQRWSCRACNFEVGGVDGWLCVPEARCQAQALEAVTFYLLGSDLSLEVSVRADECPLGSPAPTAMQLAQTVATELTRGDASARQQLVLPWPHAAMPGAPSGYSAAKVRIEQDGGRQTCVVHLVTLGRLQHLLLLRGSNSQTADHTAAIDRLLRSFRILDPTRSPAAACTQALQHHTGGTWEGDAATGLWYRNPSLGLSLQGPAGWVAGRRCGGALVRVVWEGPQGGRMWLHGYAVPPGLSHWCQHTANLWLQRLAAASGLDLPAELPAFQPCHASTHPRCEWLCVQRPAIAGIPGRTRWLTVMLRPDLLVVVDAAPGSRDQEPALRTALSSLQLR